MLWDEALACRYGTFLVDSEAQRCRLPPMHRTRCLWDWLDGAWTCACLLTCIMMSTHGFEMILTIQGYRPKRRGNLDSSTIITLEHNVHSFSFLFHSRFSSPVISILVLLTRSGADAALRDAMFPLLEPSLPALSRCESSAALINHSVHFLFAPVAFQSLVADPPAPRRG